MADSDDDPSSVKETLGVLGINKVVPEIYGDLLKPAAQELGTGLVILAKAVKAALFPIEGMVWGYENIRTYVSLKVTQRLAKTKPENIQPPPRYVAGPVLLNLRFVGKVPNLQEMYANLLAASMDKTTVQQTHPAFVSVIQQLSSDEAVILRKVQQAGIELIRESYESDDDELLIESHVRDCWREFCQIADVTSLGCSGAYLDNLLRLRLLERTHESHESYGAGGPRQRHHALVRVTEFGRDFLKASVSA